MVFVGPKVGFSVKFTETLCRDLSQLRIAAAECVEHTAPVGGSGMVGWLGPGRSIQKELNNLFKRSIYPLYIGDEKLPRYIGIIINHYKDPY